MIRKDEARIDSRLLALHLKKKRHQDLFELVKRYEVKLLALGKVLFQTGASTGSSTGQRERFALLNEDQAFFVLTLSRNTPTVVDLNLKMIQAFGEARRAAQMRGVEYLPTYHALHDQIHALTAGSPNERFVHMNVNKLVNQTAGIEAGQRASATVPVQSMLAVAQAVAAKAMQQAPNHRTGFRQTKAALLALTKAALLALTQATMIGRTAA
ncbi:Rha family transcriptional regulator [Malikia sp.]|uniref:Rha family transcriptional regulator n=1 Tax=Malikia sp. TaxID=2070706 RepID=UPI00261F5015|nr:Rha family transcriptional regulator [Malikia sp.]